MPVCYCFSLSRKSCLSPAAPIIKRTAVSVFFSTSIPTRYKPDLSSKHALALYCSLMQLRAELSSILPLIHFRFCRQLQLNFQEIIYEEKPYQLAVVRQNYHFAIADCIRIFALDNKITESSILFHDCCRNSLDEFYGLRSFSNCCCMYPFDRSFPRADNIYIYQSTQINEQSC